ncbi:hypothetical protein HAX54_043446 [Datura stramonium]|uniref:Uncharacterized protein n=1 Tax=Datura stramonium TaxID=4076 RepID=A0ABS8W5M0_DATST|nr:hypothetical protein [Datura stramonium]
MEECLKCLLESLDRWSLKQQEKELFLPQFDDYAEISSPAIDSSATELELLEGMFLATLFTKNEGGVYSKFGRDVVAPPLICSNQMPERNSILYSELLGKEVLSRQARFDKILFKVTTSYSLWLNLEKDEKTCPCEEVEKLAFLIIDERSILIAEEISKVWIDGFLSLVESDRYIHEARKLLMTWSNGYRIVDDGVTKKAEDIHFEEQPSDMDVKYAKHSTVVPFVDGSKTTHGK